MKIDERNEVITWKLCALNSPEENEDVLLTIKLKSGFRVCEARFKNNGYYYYAETNQGEYEELYTVPISWTSMPKPYLPKE